MPCVNDVRASVRPMRPGRGACALNLTTILTELSCLRIIICRAVLVRSGAMRPMRSR